MGLETVYRVSLVVEKKTGVEKTPVCGMVLDPKTLSILGSHVSELVKGFGIPSAPEETPKVKTKEEKPTPEDNKEKQE